VIWAIHNVLSSEIGIAAYTVIPSEVEESERRRPFDCAQGDIALLRAIWAAYNVIPSEVEESERARPFDCAQGDITLLRVTRAAYNVIPSEVEESERARPFDCAQGDIALLRVTRAAYNVIPSEVEESERARPFDYAQGDMVGGHSNAQGDTAAASEAMLYLALPSWKMKSTETNFTEGIDRGGV
jgi:hypothetical protein